jgi:pyruvate decarboxylase
LGKGILNETHPTFVGIYNGLVSYPGVREAMESSDFVINTGPLLSDSNSGGFTRSIKPENVVEIYSDYVVLKGQRYSDIAMKSRRFPIETPINC